MTFTPLPIDGNFSTNNRTTTPLTANNTYTGTNDDVRGYNSYNIFLKSDVSGKLTIQFSPDGTNYDESKIYVFDISKESYLNINGTVNLRYIKLSYLNGSTNQTYFRLTTTYNVHKSNTHEQETYFNHQNVDLFNRLITVSPEIGISVNRIMSLNTENISYKSDVTLSHNTNHASVDLTISTANQVSRSRTRRRLKYQPSKVITIFATGVLVLSYTANADYRIGMFDDNNGFFFAHRDGTNYIVHRSYTSGSVVDTEIAESDWNGNGAIDFTFDETKANIYMFQFGWLGVSSCKAIIIANGKQYLMHTFYFENSLTTCYMTFATLPISWEIIGSGTSGAGTLRAICGSASSLGGLVINGNAYTINTGVTSVEITNVETPVISIKITGGSVILDAVQILLKRLSLICTSNANIIIRIRKWQNKTPAQALTGSSFSSIGNDSGGDYDVAATAIASTDGSYIIDSYYFSRTVDGIDIPIDDMNKLLLYDQLNSISDIISVTCQNTTGTTEDIFCSVNLISFI